MSALSRALMMVSFTLLCLNDMYFKGACALARLKREFFTGECWAERFTNIIRSGYSSLILLMRRVPMPEPVPPPREWHTWKPAEMHHICDH